MRLLKNRQNLVSLAILGLLLTLVLPATAIASQNGKNRGDDADKRARKCAKFVNCHDASDGRVDGRGPRADRNKRLHTRNRSNDRRNDRSLRTRTNRRFGVREVNRVNTARIRKTRG